MNGQQTQISSRFTCQRWEKSLPQFRRLYFTRSLAIHRRLFCSYEWIHRWRNVISVVWIRTMIGRFTTVAKLWTGIRWFDRTEYTGWWFQWRSVRSSWEIASRTMVLSASRRERHLRIVKVPVVDNRTDHLFDLSLSFNPVNTRKALINTKWICCLSLSNCIELYCICIYSSMFGRDERIYPLGFEVSQLS